MSRETVAQQLYRLVVDRPLPAAPVSISLPPTDDEAEAEKLAQRETNGETFIIEYRDAGGHFSTRRITVESVGHGPYDAVYLFAYCHERQALRQFRIDRIEACIDFDGEVHEDVETFLTQTIGLRPHERPRKGDTREAWELHHMFSTVAPEAMLLAAMMRSDGLARPEELETILAELILLIERRHGRGQIVDGKRIRIIGKLVTGLRPSPSAIARAIDRIAEDRSPDDITRLILIAAEVMDADGQRHSAEKALLNALALDLIGTPVLP